MSGPLMPSLNTTSLDGGVEEKKEDDPLSPMNVLFNEKSDSRDKDFDEQKDGFHAQIKQFTRTILGGCNSALAFLVDQAEGCAWQGGADDEIPPKLQRVAPVKPPLSIADELRELAAKEGREFGSGGVRRYDIPRFLGEEAVHDFDDDAVSEISQQTLEELAKHGIRRSVRRRQSCESYNSTHTPPSPIPEV